MVVPPPTKSQAPRRARADAPSEPLDPGAGTAPGTAPPPETDPEPEAGPSLETDAGPTVTGTGVRSRRSAVLALLALAVVMAAGLAWAAVDRGSGPSGSTATDPEATVAPAGPATESPPSSVVPGSVVTVSASQSTVIVAGAVPSQAIAEELVGRAGAVYTPDQVQNQLAADPATRSPIVVVVKGATTDPALFNRLTSAFTGIVGIDTIELAGLRLDEPSELEAALMGLPSIQFAPATAELLPESLPVLDQMTALLAAAPGTAIEIGVHTDTRGSAEANRALSQARADAALDALAQRGVVNPMAARGFGESRPAVVPDDTPLTQEVNRRVELRVL